jgi:hypothetical protein
MASASNDKEKTPPGDDHQDLQLKEEVESEAEEEEMEEDQSSRPNTMIASIGVVTSQDKFKKSARIRTGGGVPRHSLAPRTSSSDRSNRAAKESSKSEDGWGNNSKSWDSQTNKFMRRIEHNLDMIRNLTYKIDELKELIEKLIKDSPPPPKE